MSAVAAGSELIVDAERGLPAICLKCGKRKHIVRRSERFIAASATQGLSFAGAAGGVMVARAMQDDALLGALVLGGSIAGAVVVGLVVQSRAPKVQLAIPLCRECNERWRTGLRARYAILTALCAGGAAFAYGFFLHDAMGYVVGGALFAAMIVAALAFRLRDRFVFASSIQGSRAVLKGVSDEARSAIEAKRLKRGKSVSS
ncbi:MAG TPA: hypothetical protein VGH28_17510 [Polyangiaceae bacterium]|jgi:hypothetical protein